jgi:hypothetical protein
VRACPTKARGSAIAHEITALLAPWFAARSLPDFAKMFDEAGVTWSIFRDFATALAEDPDLSLQNPMFSRIEQPGIGAYRVPGTPMSFTGRPARPRCARRFWASIPRRSSAMWRDCRMSEIAALFDTGIVAQAVRPGDVDAHGLRGGGGGAASGRLRQPLSRAFGGSAPTRAAPPEFFARMKEGVRQASPGAPPAGR